MTTTELIAALEKADAPSRELDAEIAVAFGWGRQSSHYLNINGATESHTLWLRPGSTSKDLGELIDEMREAGATNALMPDSLPPRYTSSIDAALSLVPEGWRFVRFEHPRSDEPCLAALVAPDGFAKGKAQTPAIAIVIACLRAQGGGG